MMSSKAPYKKSMIRRYETWNLYNFAFYRLCAAGCGRRRCGYRLRAIRRFCRAEFYALLSLARMARSGKFFHCANRLFSAADLCASGPYPRLAGFGGARFAVLLAFSAAFFRARSLAAGMAEKSVFFRSLNFHCGK